MDDFLISIPNSEGLLISHPLFADDTLMFCKLNESNQGYLGCILLPFKAMSGLRVNLSKSALIPIGEVPNVDVSALFLVGQWIVFLFELLMRAKWFGAPLLRGSIREWKVGNISFCLEAVD